MQHIETVVVGSGGAASITFSAIPDTYTDLVVLYSGRTNRASTNDYTSLILNGATTYESARTLWGYGSSTVITTTNDSYLATNSTDSRANTFSNASIYLPNYTSSAKKSVSIDNAYDGNTADTGEQIAAVLYNLTTPITSITLDASIGTLLIEGTRAHLYGITAGSDGIVSVS